MNVEAPAAVEWSSREALLGELSVPEPEAGDCLDRFLGLVDPCTGIVTSLQRDAAQCEDEPVFPAVRACLAPTVGLSDGGYERAVAVGGRALDLEAAAIAALFEAIERHCLSIYRSDRLVWTSFDELSAAGYRAVDPAALASRRGPGRRPPTDLRSALLRWTAGWSLRAEGPILVPAQAVYVPYRWEEGEPVLRDPLTTGAAAGLGPAKAFLRGLLEVVERDATMLVHYRQKPCPRLAAEPCQRLAGMVEVIDAFGLETRLYDCTLDLPVPVVVAVVLDGTGVGPAVTVGSKAALGPEEAAIGALLEAVCFRHPMRARMADARRLAAQIGHRFECLERADWRAYRWAQPDMVGHLDYLDGGVACPPGTQPVDLPADPRALVEAILALPADVVVCDVTSPEMAGLGVHVVKVVVPQLQPMHLSESMRCWTDRLCSFDGDEGGHWDPDRLVPHPFL